MIDIIGLGSSLPVVTPLVVMPRLAVAYSSDPEPKTGKRRRKYRTMPGREPPRFRAPSVPQPSEYPA
jgi:hypothetical protein